MLNFIFTEIGLEYKGQDQDFGCRDNEIVEFRSLRGGRRAKNRITALNFRESQLIFKDHFSQAFL